MAAEKYFIGVDIGGHNIRVAVCDQGGEILRRGTAGTDRKAASASVNVDIAASQIENVILQARVDVKDVARMAVGVPGVTDTRKGVVVSAPNVPHWYDLSLKQMFEQRFSFPIILDNDVNMAAVGEYWKGAARGCSDFFFLALGTGIGGGIFVNGRLYRGAHFGAGEAGYFVLEPDQRHRRIGDLGWLESIASGWAIEQAGRQAAREHPYSFLNRAVNEPDQVRASDVFEAARHGDGPALEILDEVTGYLALTIINVAALLDPELIVFGGGVSSQGEQILGSVREKAQGFGVKVPPLCLSELQDDAQLYGTLFTALQDDGSI